MFAKRKMRVRGPAAREAASEELRALMHPLEDRSAHDGPDRRLVEIPCEAGKSPAGFPRVRGVRPTRLLGERARIPGRSSLDGQGEATEPSRAGIERRVIDFAERSGLPVRKGGKARMGSKETPLPLKGFSRMPSEPAKKERPLHGDAREIHRIF